MSDEIRQVTIGEGARRRPPVPHAPLVEVLRREDPVGVLHVTVPPGGAMPEHDHGPSTTMLVPLAGSVQLIDVADGERRIDVSPGSVTTIPIGRRVRLENGGDADARLLVVLSPPDFAQQAAGWPGAD